MGRRYGTDRQNVYFKAFIRTGNNHAACVIAQVNDRTGARWSRERRKVDPEFNALMQNRGKFIVGPQPDFAATTPGLLGTLGPEAEQALTDFAFFRHRYLGRRSTPWQEEAAENVVRWVTSDQTEYIVVNCPPGSGKSTLFVNDIPLWLICRDRTIRILIGSSTGKLASQYTGRIRRTLERTRPLPASVDREAATGCLAIDYGRFKPDTGADIWRREEFTVLANVDTHADGRESSVEDKESTCQAFGADSDFLGDRADLVVWDDLVTNKTLRSLDAVEAQRSWWADEAETRVEPGGALILQGQRLAANDLYRHCLDMKLGSDIDGDDQSKYRHIIYPAHFDNKCEGDHGPDAKPYPAGCLLDPWRLPWEGRSGLLTVQRNRMEKYRVVYQQEDVDADNVLVLPVWINGGRGQDGVDYPGCWDHHRGFANDLDDMPRGLSIPWYSIVSVDPSPTMWWAIEWWLYHPASEQRFLLDLHRAKMDAPDLLEWNENLKIFHGLMEDWQQRSRRLGAPISHWIVEQNAAQRWLLSTDAMKRWRSLHGVNVVGHNTVATNKLDPDYGIPSIRDRYRFGNVRLPGKTGNWSSARAIVAQTLVKEATRYPEKGTTDDCLMAQWFFEYNLQFFAKPLGKQQPKVPVPAFVRGAA